MDKGLGCGIRIEVIVGPYLENDLEDNELIKTSYIDPICREVVELCASSDINADNIYDYLDEAISMIWKSYKNIERKVGGMRG